MDSTFWTIIIGLAILGAVFSGGKKSKKRTTSAKPRTTSSAPRASSTSYSSTPRSSGSSSRGSYMNYSSITMFTHLAPAAFKKKAAKSFVSLDFETTGLHPRRDRIVEIGAVLVENGHIVDRYSQLVNPCVPIPPEASRINNITDMMVKGQPMIDKALPALLSFIGDRPVVTHNAAFDMAFLEAALTSCGKTAALSYADSLQIARKALPNLENHKLGTVATALGVTIRDQHRAVGDAEAVAQILLKLWNQ